LLRKRLEPDISTWANKARVKGAKLERGENDEMPIKDWETLWDWAGVEANAIAKQFYGAGDEEEYEEDEEEDNEDTPNKMDVDVPKVVNKASGPAMPLDQLLGFAVTGTMPPNRNFPSGMRRP
jgi:hypothetical protein